MSYIQATLQEQTYQSLTAHHWGGIGCTVDFDFNVPLDGDDFVTSETLIINDSQRTSHNTYENDGTGKAHVHFKILLQKPGHNLVSFVFRTAGGLYHTFNRVIDVQPYLTHAIKTYKVRRMTDDEMDEQINSKPFAVGVNNYVMSQFSLISPESDPDYNKYIYRQYINCGPEVGLNHMIAVRLQCDEGTGATTITNKALHNGNGLVDLRNRRPVEILSDCESNLDDYWWFLNPVVDWSDVPESTSTNTAINNARTYILVGICKGYDDVSNHDEYVHVYNYDGAQINTMVRTGKPRLRDGVYFLPMFHVHEDAGERFEFSKDDMLCVAPTITGERDDVHLLYDGENFSHAFDGVVWKFENTSTGTVYSSTIGSVHQPFMLPYDAVTLDSGYYDVVMDYNYGEDGSESYTTRRSLLLIR